jgi:hypothetical protein
MFHPNPAKLIRLDAIGALVGAADFQARLQPGSASARPLCKVRKTGGAQWTVAFVEGAGVAVASHQTHRVFVIECQTLIDLACEAGVEDRAGHLVVPNSHRP